jgi:hypothetical protein
MTTIANAAVTAMVDALKRAPAVATHVDRVRLRPVAQNVSQAIAVRAVESEPTEDVALPGYPVAWLTTITVECYAKNSANTTPDLAVDSLVQAAYARLMEDTTLGGAVIALYPKGASFDFDADGEQTVCVSLVFRSLQRSSAGLIVS